MSAPLRSARARRAGILLAVGCSVGAVPATAGASAVGLGTAAPFVVLAGSTATNTGPSVLHGDLGVSPGTALVGFGQPAVVNGATHANDAVAAQAQSDLTTAYDVAAGQPVSQELTGQDLGGLTLTAGAYHFASSAQLTGRLTLDAQGDPDAQFVFEIGSTLTTASASSVVMINGASPCNVYWQVGSSATLGTTTAFQGTIMALTSATLNDAATVQGRVLARNGAVTLQNNTLDASMCQGSTTGGTGTATAPGTGTGTVTGGTATGKTGTQLSPPGTTTAPTHNGSATLRHSGPSSRASSCTRGFRATVRGRMIRRVVFSVAGRRIAGLHRSPFAVYVKPATGRRGTLLARVTFTDATHARTLRFHYRACSAAVLHPVRGPSKFTG